MFEPIHIIAKEFNLIIILFFGLCQIFVFKII